MVGAQVGKDLTEQLCKHPAHGHRVKRKEVADLRSFSENPTQQGPAEMQSMHYSAGPELPAADPV